MKLKDVMSMQKFSKLLLHVEDILHFFSHCVRRQQQVNAVDCILLQSSAKHDNLPITSRSLCLRLVRVAMERIKLKDVMDM